MLMSALDENVKVDLKLFFDHFGLIRLLINIRPYLGLTFWPKTNVPDVSLFGLYIRSKADAPLGTM